MAKKRPRRRTDAKGKPPAPHVAPREPDLPPEVASAPPAPKPKGEPKPEVIRGQQGDQNRPVCPKHGCLCDAGKSSISYTYYYCPECKAEKKAATLKVQPFSTKVLRPRLQQQAKRASQAVQRENDRHDRTGRA